MQTSVSTAGPQDRILTHTDTRKLTNADGSVCDVELGSMRTVNVCAY